MVSSDDGTNGAADAVESVETMSLDGGEPCLDFVNTASGRAHGPFREKLGDYGDLVTFAERVGVVHGGLAKRLRTAASRSPEEAEEVLLRARALRESIFRLFARGPGGEDLERVGEEAGRAAAARRLAVDGEGYAFEWPEAAALDRVLWPLAQSAAELLTSEARERVKECAANNCNWLFLDVSRNRSRRWCDMAVCGNRAKARRYSERHRS